MLGSKSSYATLRDSVACVLIVLFGLGCELQAEPKNNNEQKAPSAVEHIIKDSPSGSAFLSLKDAVHFKPGRSKADVLKDVNWRGQFEIACTYENKEYCSITYQLFSDDPWGKGAAYVEAIFRDKKFLKFVGSEKSPERQSKLPSIFDFNRYGVAETIKLGPVDLLNLQKQALAQPETPSHVDPVLTTIYVLSGGLLIHASERDYQRNVQLGDQFNPAKLDIGMTRAKIEDVFKAKPLESGSVSEGQYAIYGSNELFDIATPLHFTNVLVAYQEDRAALICTSRRGSTEWRAELQRSFPELRVDNSSEKHK